jgi:hypothetical protein
VLSRSLTRAAFLTVLVLGIVAGAVRPPSSPDPAAGRHTEFDGIRSAPTPLPASIAAVELTAGRLLTAIVAADIDADGDLDLVASDSALELHVWVNDGAGHFTRRDPIQSTSWHPLPAAPTVDGRAVSIESFTQSNPPSVSADWRLIAWSLDASAFSLTRLAAAPSTDHRSTRVARAPPLSTTL